MNSVLENLSVGQDLKSEARSDFWELKSNVEINIHSIGEPKCPKVIALNPLDWPVFKCFLNFIFVVNCWLLDLVFFLSPHYATFRQEISYCKYPTWWHVVEAKQIVKFWWLKQRKDKWNNEWIKERRREGGGEKEQSLGNMTWNKNAWVQILTKLLL